MEDFELAALARERVKAKKTETEAIQARRDIDLKILLALGHLSEGTLQRHVNGVSVKASFSTTRKTDTDALRAGWTKLSAVAQKAFRWKADVDVKALKAMQLAAPADFDLACAYIDSSPAAPSVEVELHDVEQAA